MSKYLVIDTEIEGKDYRERFCDPLELDNKVVMIQAKSYASSEAIYKYSEEGLPRNYPFILDGYDVMVGQNIKFDLLFFWNKSKALMEWIHNGGKIWDTKLADYLLNGQNKLISYSLDSICNRRGLPQKPDIVKVRYDQGETTLEIIDNLGLKTYLEYALGDVYNTESVYLSQVKEATYKGMLPLIETYMEHLLALCEIEINGLKVDKAALEKNYRKLGEGVEGLTEDLQKDFVKDNIYAPLEGFTFNPSSPTQVSAALFGGHLKWKCKKGTGYIYKSGKKAGQEKTKITEMSCHVAGRRLNTAHTEKNESGTAFSTGEEVLNKYKEDEFVQKLMHFKKVNKEYGFYKKYPELINPYTGCIHGSYNTTVTPTGRLSCSSPNLQQIPSHVGEVFTSRFPNGVLISFDYSQLEVVVQAWLSGCEKMLEHIEQGVDFHCKRLAYAENRSYEEVYDLCKIQKIPEWVDKRRKAKVISFRKAYGALPRTIAEDIGLSEEVVKQVFRREDEEYPEIEEFYNRLREQRSSNIWTVFGDWKGDEEAHTLGCVKVVTCKRYCFESIGYDRESGIFKFPEPAMYNYPIQGTAADIVSRGVGDLYRALTCHKSGAILISEVHDDVKLDVPDESYVEELIGLGKKVLGGAGKRLGSSLGFEFNIELKVDAAIGKTWRELKDE